MSVKPLIRAAVAAALFLAPGAVFADGIMVMDPYARSSRPGAPTGAAFMTLHNTTDEDDTLVAASSDVAKRVELHTHIDKGDGVMQMVELENGIPVPAGEMHSLQRGGDHVMFMGLNSALEQGATVSVTLTFEKAGDMVVEIPVDNERKPKHGAKKHSH